MVTLDLDFVRGHFPALASDMIFFENAGGSQTLKLVVDRIAEYLLTSDVQWGAPYPLSQKAEQRVMDATREIATFMNVAQMEELVMGASTSMLFKILSCCVSKTFAPGDEIIVTNVDHEANVSPWSALAELGFVVKIWRCNPDTFRFELDDLEALMSEKTRLVAVTHTSNVLGTINPIRQIADFVHRHGALICVDGVAYTPHRAVDVQALDVDFYAFSFYKVYGPHYSVLYGRKALLEDMPGFNHYFLNSPPYKFQPGNVNFEFAHGVAGIPEYFRRLASHHFGEGLSPRDSIVRAYDLIAAHEERLAERFLNFLDSKSSVKVIGERSHDRMVRVPTISFTVAGKAPQVIAETVGAHGVGMGRGDFYAKKLIESAGLTERGGVCRVSMVHYNSFAEVDRLIEIMDSLF